MPAVEEVALREPVTIKMPIKETDAEGKEVTIMVERKIDDPNKVRAARVCGELQNWYDELLGIRDVSIVKEVVRQGEELARLRKLAEKQGTGNAESK